MSTNLGALTFGSQMAGSTMASSSALYDWWAPVEIVEYTPNERTSGLVECPYCGTAQKPPADLQLCGRCGGGLYDFIEGSVLSGRRR